MKNGGENEVRENNRKSIARIGKLPQFTTMNVIDGQAVQGLYASLIFYSLTIDNILNIIVLLILAGVAISTLAGNDNILNNAETAVDKYNEKAEAEEAVLNTLEKKLIEFSNGGGTSTDTPPEEPEIPYVTTATEIQSATKEYKDAKENKIVVPGGFRVRTDLATTVDKGIVIEDGAGNQFVWVPVGTITKSNGNQETIELGRYTFVSNDEASADASLVAGTAILQQSASNYQSSVPIYQCWVELTEFRESNFMRDSSGENIGVNATAFDLKEWIETTSVNGGYYIARYEASFGSGDKISNFSDGVAGVTNQKPQFKQSTSYSRYPLMWETITSTTGMLWNCIRQGDASKACRNMYEGNEYNGKDYVDCDLVNGYAWDTAIVFIEKCSENSNYANKNCGSNTELYNTGTDDGKTTDMVCNIYDMAGNLQEWTTEYCN